MRTDLPWNVAGIPPEAREAARAAARREGLSVGEWLTRRILRSFSDLGEEAPATMADSWNIPPGLSRRDTEEMLAHVTRSESTSSDLARRIEDQLRGVTRRLDSAERSQSENSRAMSRAAAEINVATREQSQAFDQLGSHVMSLSERLARLERHTADTGMKDAVKGLHLGLSRLADQFTQTANQSAAQITSVVANLEQLATRLEQTRQETEYVSRALDDRLSAVERAAEASANTLERAVSAFEERTDITLTAQSETAAAISSLQEQINILEGKIADTSTAVAIEKLQDSINALEQRLADTSAATAIERLQDQVGVLEEKLSDPSTANEIGKLKEIVGELETHASDTTTTVAIAKLQDTIGILESRISDPSTDRRLNSIEQSLAGLASELAAERNDTSTADTIRLLSQKIEKVEKRHGEDLAALHEAVGTASQRLSAVETNSQAFATPIDTAAEKTERDFETLFRAEDDFQADEPFGLDDTIAPDAVDAAPLEAETDPVFETPVDDPTDASGYAPFVSGEISAEQTSFDTPPFTAETDRLPSSATDPFAEQDNTPPTVESYLNAARQSARAAAATAEAERMRGPLGGFNWSPGPDAATESTAKKSLPRYFWPAVIGGLVVLALIAGLLLRQTEQSSLSAPASTQAASTTAHNEAASDIVVARQQPPAAVTPSPETAISSDSTPASAASPTSPTARNSVATATQPAKSTQGTTALDRLTALANNGNVTAEAIVGFRYLEGDGVTASPVQAAKWLERAAEQGQAVAQSALGQMYEEGQGVTKDPVKAVRWYQSAAAQGNRKAMHNLALTYVNGIGQKKDATEGVRWFLRAANLGVADSQFNLAVLYESGLGVSQSLLEAYKWYLISAAQGDRESKARVEALRTQLTADDRAAAERSAAGFRASPINPKSNNVPRLTDLPAN